MKKTSILTIFVLSILLTSCFTGNKKAPVEKPKNIILLIGDGMGLGQIHAGMTANKGDLNMLTFPVSGLNRTKSADAYITDSGAGATALSTGKKTNNYRIALGINNEPLKTILEYAEEKGLSTGVISTSSITHATPAAFLSHNINRDNEEEIAVDIMNSNAEIIIGGGRIYFTERRDQLNLLDSMQSLGYGVYESLEDVNTSEHNKIIALTALKHNKKMTEGRGNMLLQAAEIAIEKLSENGKGFFLMIEGSFIDKACHENDKDYLLQEVLDFDKVTGFIKSFAEKNGETLVIVTADHETGALSIINGNYETGEVELHFAKKGGTTNEHCGIMVPVFAYGPASLEFTGVYENTEIFQKMMNAFQW